jgi:hypothetical protein
MNFKNNKEQKRSNNNTTRKTDHIVYHQSREMDTWRSEKREGTTDVVP